MMQRWPERRRVRVAVAMYAAAVIIGNERLAVWKAMPLEAARRVTAMIALAN